MNKIVITGAKNTGIETALTLQDENKIFIYEPDREKADMINNRDYPVSDRFKKFGREFSAIQLPR